MTRETERQRESSGQRDTRFATITRASSLEDHSKEAGSRRQLQPHGTGIDGQPWLGATTVAAGATWATTPGTPEAMSQRAAPRGSVARGFLSRRPSSGRGLIGRTGHDGPAPPPSPSSGRLVSGERAGGPGISVCRICAACARAWMYRRRTRSTAPAVVDGAHGLVVV